MRVTAGKTIDANYMVVLLDGKKVKMCIEADDDRGYVDCYAELPGSNPPRYTQLTIHRLFGNVRILDIRHMTPEQKFELDIKD